VKQYCLSYNSTVRKKIWLVGSHHNDPIVIYAERDLGIVVKRFDVFCKRFALVQDFVVRENGIVNDSSRKLFKVLALRSFHNDLIRKR
jgi:soluble P-type ATPase